MKNKLVVEHLRQTEFPNTRHFNQLIHLKRRDGGIITDTWKYCVKSRNERRYCKEYISTDQPFDKLYKHKAIIIRDILKDKIVAWGLVLIGSFDESPDTKLSTVQLYVRPSCRNLHLGSKLFNEFKKILRKESVEIAFYYGDKSNTRFFNKMKRAYKEDFDMVNVYKIFKYRNYKKKTAA